MATKFKYEARDATGKVVKGAISAASQSMAVAEVRRRNHLLNLLQDIKSN